MRYAHLYRVANLCGDALRVVIHPNRSKMLHEVPRVPETRIQKLQSLRRDDYKVVLTLVANAVRGGRGRGTRRSVPLSVVEPLATSWFYERWRCYSMRPDECICQPMESRRAGVTDTIYEVTDPDWNFHEVARNVIEGATGRRGAQWVRDDLSPKDAFAAALATIYVGLDLRRIDL